MIHHPFLRLDLVEKWIDTRAIDLGVLRFGLEGRYARPEEVIHYELRRHLAGCSLTEDEERVALLLSAHADELGDILDAYRPEGSPWICAGVREISESWDDLDSAEMVLANVIEEMNLSGDDDYRCLIYWAPVSRFSRAGVRTTLARCIESRMSIYRESAMLDGRSVATRARTGPGSAISRPLQILVDELERRSPGRFIVLELPLTSNYGVAEVRIDFAPSTANPAWMTVLDTGYAFDIGFPTHESIEAFDLGVHDYRYDDTIRTIQDVARFGAWQRPWWHFMLIGDPTVPGDAATRDRLAGRRYRCIAAPADAEPKESR